MPDLVIGGVSVPRFLCCGANLIDNPDFEENTSGWFGRNGASVSRFEDSDTFFGDYALRINDASASFNGWAEDILSPGVSTGSQTYVVSLWARGATSSDTYMRLAIADGVTGWGSAKTLTTTQQHFSSIISYTQSHSHCRVRIYPCALASETSIIIVDRVAVYRVLYDITLDYESQDDNWAWKQEMQAENRLIDGTMKSYVDGWRFTAQMNFDLLSATDEANRSRISEADTVVFFPRSDNDFCAVTRWTENYDRRYFGRNLYTAGHKGPIALRGLELMEKKPVS